MEQNSKCFPPYPQWLYLWCSFQHSQSCSFIDIEISSEPFSAHFRHSHNTIVEDFTRSCLSPPNSIWTPVDSSGLHWTPVHSFHSQVIPKLSMTGVEWSPVESSGLDSPCGVHMDFCHWKTLLEWTGLHWTPLDSSGLQQTLLKSVINSALLI